MQRPVRGQCCVQQSRGSAASRSTGQKRRETFFQNGFIGTCADEVTTLRGIRSGASRVNFTRDPAEETFIDWLGFDVTHPPGDQTNS